MQSTYCPSAIHPVPRLCHSNTSQTYKQIPETTARQQQLDQSRAHMESKSPLTEVVKYHASLPTEEVQNATHPTWGA